jgi:hypothetical protein
MRRIVGFVSIIVGCLAFVSIAALIGLASNTSKPYPTATYTSMRIPVINSQVRRNCLTLILVNKSCYTVPDKHKEVIGWLEDEGWMGNFRNADSVLQQSSKNFLGLTFGRVQKIFVEDQSVGANLVWTTQTILTLGNC